MPALRPLELADGAAVLANAKAVRERLWPKPTPMPRPAPILVIEPAFAPAVPAISIEDATNILAVSLKITPAEVLLRLAQPLLVDETGPHSVASIKLAVSKVFKTSIKEIEGASRTVPIVRIRHFAIALARHLTKQSTTLIARRFGGKDHSSIVHAIQKSKWLIDELALSVPDGACTEQWVRAGQRRIAEKVAREEATKATSAENNRAWRAKNRDVDNMRRRLKISIHEARRLLAEATL